MKSLSVTIQMKAFEQYFPVVLFLLYKVVLSFDSVDEILKCVSFQMKSILYLFYSNLSICIIPYDAVYYSAQSPSIDVYIRVSFSMT